VAYINIDGVKIYYATNRRSWKKATDKQLIFVHGAGGDHRTWVYQMSYFRGQYAVYAVDLPGHGFSGGEGFSEIEKYADFIKKFLIVLGLKDSILIGHSMGGAIILMVALNPIEHLKGLVLVGSGARLRVNPMFLEKFKEINEESAELFCKYAFAEECDKNLIDASKEMIYRTKSEVFYNDFVACDKFDIMQELYRIEVPVLVIGSTEDKMTPLKYSEYLNKNIKGSELSIIEGAGHMLMMEKYKEVNQAIGNWLRKF